MCISFYESQIGIADLEQAPYEYHNLIMQFNSMKLLATTLMSPAVISSDEEDEDEEEEEKNPEPDSQMEDTERDQAMGSQGAGALIPKSVCE